MTDTLIIAITFIAICGFLWLGSLTMALMGALFGIRVRELKFGTGMPLLKFHIGSTAVSFGVFPFSGHLRFSDNRFEENSDKVEVSFDSKPKLVRFLITSSGFLVPLIPFVMILGPDVLPVVREAIPQLISGALSPLGEAQNYLQSYVQVTRDVGFSRPLAEVLLKISVPFLLPISPAVGLGQALCSMCNEAPGPKVQTWTTITALAYIAYQASWGVAMIIFVF